jgi:glutaredoxin-related protein
MSRLLLAEENIQEPAQKSINSFYSDTVNEVIGAISKNRIVVVGMSVNPVVKKAKKLLDKEELDYKYLEYGSYLSGWHKRLAIKLWSGWPTYPQVFIEGKLVGGYSELKELFK